MVTKPNWSYANGKRRDVRTTRETVDRRLLAVLPLKAWQA